MLSDVPKPHSCVHAAGDKGLVIGRESNAANAMPVALKSCELVPRRDIPQFGGVVVATRGKKLAVMAECQ